MREMEQLHKESLTALRLEALERERAAVRRMRDEADAALAAEREASEEAMQALGQEEEDRVRRKVKEAQRAWERQRAQLEGQVRAGLQQLAAQEKQVPPPTPTPPLRWQARPRAAPGAEAARLRGQRPAGLLCRTLRCA
jgi:uncharacterized protein YhaN